MSSSLSRTPPCHDFYSLDLISGLGLRHLPALLQQKAFSNQIRNEPVSVFGSISDLHPQKLVEISMEIYR